MSVQADLLPTHTEKTLGAMKAERMVKQITFDPAEASPGATLYARVPKLNENEVLVPGLLALVFDIDLPGGHANNFLVKNVSRALIDKLVVKYGATFCRTRPGRTFSKSSRTFFLSQEERDNMLLEGIQSENLCKIRSNAGEKPTSGVAAENKLVTIYGKKYRIRLDLQILTDHGVIYPNALYKNLTFDIKLAPASQVVKGSDTTKLKYSSSDFS